jgi:lipase maturation factor 1
MTTAEYEIEFQGTRDGKSWTPYPFRYKPQDPNVAPGLYAPYQPRFEWNLWFASLGAWRDNMFVVSAEERLLAGSPDVLALFANNPFTDAPPKQVRAVVWEYWFTSLAEKRATGAWWRRKLLGLYAPTLTYMPDGQVGVVEWPPQMLPRP